MHFIEVVFCGFAPVGASQLGAGIMFAVKCLFAIDAIAIVYRAEPPRFEHAGADKMVFVIDIGDNSSDGVRLCDPT